MTNQQQQLHNSVQLASSQGIEQGGWRWPTEDAGASSNEDSYIKAAQLAEQAKLDGLFMTDVPSVNVDLRNQPPQASLDPVVLLALRAKATERLGLRQHLGLPYQNGLANASPVASAATR